MLVVLKKTIKESAFYDININLIPLIVSPQSLIVVGVNSPTSALISQLVREIIIKTRTRKRKALLLHNFF